MIECPELDDPYCGMVEWTSLFPGGVATYTCNHSCELNGDPTRNCTYDGTWSGEEPTCERKLLSPLHVCKLFHNMHLRVGIGLQKIVACSQSSAVPSCIYNFWHVHPTSF